MNGAEFHLPRGSIGLPRTKSRIDGKRSTKEQGNPAPEYSHEVNIEEIEHRATLFRIVSTLPVDQRHVILQRFVEQKSIREIAKELQRSEGAIKQLQFRALQNLRTRMGETNG